MANFNLSTGQKVLIVYGSQVPSQALKEFVEKLQNEVSDLSVKCTNAEIVKEDDYSPSSFDVILSNVVYPYSLQHSRSLLSMYFKFGKANGRIVVREPIAEGDQNTEEQFNSTVKLAGLVSLKPGNVVELTAEQKEALVTIHKLDSFKIQDFEASKPNFEVGSSTKINFKKPDAYVESVWKIDNNVDDDIIDSDNLLDESDLKKPDPASLKVCGTTGKRKACKDCSCGLAEELAQESGDFKAAPAQKSSCGNCYLGDAFRCASCPYIGMPAFKPGEKVQLPSSLLKSDI